MCNFFSFNCKDDTYELIYYVYYAFYNIVIDLAQNKWGKFKTH